MGAVYSNTSPWYNTPTTQDYLDILTIRAVASQPDDFFYTIQAQYNMRPDLLAHDLYGEAALWWVFAQRNMNTLQDPIFDFVPGVQIYIPKKTALFTVLGL